MTNTNKRIVDPLGYRGVGGWLTFLVISLTLLSPLALLSGMLRESEFWSRYFVRAPQLSVIIRIANIIVVCVIALSIYAGLSLWKEWPKAVKVTKLFLIILFIVSIVLPFLPLTVDIPESLHDEILEQAWSSTPLQLIYPVVWYSYLTFSKRVANTYGSKT